MKHIVALEIGSSKIKGSVGAVSPDGVLTVLAVEEMPVSGIVRYGRIQNVQDVSTVIHDIIRKLENNPAVAPRKIIDVYVALGGRSFGSITAESTLRLPAEVEITAQAIERLKNEAQYNLVTDKEVVAFIPRSYMVDNAVVSSVVGTYGNTLSGVFTTLVCSPDNKRNLERIKFSGERAVGRYYVPRVVAVGELVLTDNERQLGCMLVDCGAETTTVAIYKDGVVQYVATLPLGSRNITRDLCVGLSMTEENAELLKRTKGTAMIDRAAGEVPDEGALELNNYVQARAGEIIANVINQLSTAGFKSADLPAGIIVTGNGAKLNNFNRLLETQSKMAVRGASIDSAVIRFANPGICAPDQIDIVSLLSYALRHDAADCLEAVQPQQPERHGDVCRPATPGGGRREVDEDSLLVDDPDDDEQPQPEKPRKNADDDDFIVDDDDRGGNKTATKRRGLLDGMKKIGTWFLQTPDDGEDDE